MQKAFTLLLRTHSPLRSLATTDLRPALALATRHKHSAADLVPSAQIPPSPKLVYAAPGAQILRSFKFTSLIFSACGAIAVPALYTMDVPLEGLLGAGLSSILPFYTLHSLTRSYVAAIRVRPSLHSPHRTAQSLVSDSTRDAQLYVDQIDPIGRLRTSQASVSTLIRAGPKDTLWKDKTRGSLYWLPELGKSAPPAMQALARRVLSPSSDKAILKRASIRLQG
ncbi:MAG: hypothetical protein DHS80DRAFT_31767 [Piptocephalis tieghemiana]|nr:MAG: hypothetical protein DHS80DRAFT_31767 [Piptocephalis tieghemiana]